MSSNKRIETILHLKMCKKIAQLTKVIYQLNTANEDLEGDVLIKQEIHRRELDDVVKDAAAKINEINEKLEERVSSLTLVRDKCEQEKHKAQLEMDTLQQKVLSIEQKMQNKFREEVLTLKNKYVTHIQEMNRIKHTFQQKLVSVEQIHQQTLSASNNELTNIKQQHKTEKECIFSNEQNKINSIEKNHAEELHRIKQEMLLDKEQELLQERTTNNIRLSKLRNELEIHEANELSALQSKHLKAMQQKQNEYTIKIDEVQMEKQKMQEEITQLKSDLEIENKTNQETQQQVLDMTTDLETTKSKLKSICSSKQKIKESLDRNIRSLTEALHQSRLKINSLEENVSLIQSKFLEKEKEANDLTSKLNVMEEKIIIEEQKQMKLEKEKENVILKLNLDLKDANENVNSLNYTLNETQLLSSNRIVAGEKRNLELRNDISNIIEEKNTLASKSKEKLESLERMLQSAKVDAEKEKQKGLEEVRLLRKTTIDKIQQIEIQYQKKMAVVEDTKVQEINTLESKYVNEFKKALEEKSEALSELKAAAEKREKMIETQWKSSDESLRATINELEKKCFMDKADFEKNKLDLEMEHNRIISMMKKSIEDNKSLKSKNKLLESVIQAFDTKELEQASKMKTYDLDKEMSQLQIERLQYTIEDLEGKLHKFEAKSFKRKKEHDIEMKTMQEEHHDSLESLKKTNEEMISNMNMKHEENVQFIEISMQQKLKTLINDHADKIQSLEERLSFEKLHNDKNMKNIEIDMKEQEELYVLKADKLNEEHQREICKLTTQMEETIRKNREEFSLMKKKMWEERESQKMSFAEKLEVQRKEIEKVHKLSIQQAVEKENRKMKHSMDFNIKTLEANLKDNYEMKLNKMKKAHFVEKEVFETQKRDLISESKSLKSCNSYIIERLKKKKRSLLILKKSLIDIKSKYESDKAELISESTDVIKKVLKKITLDVTLFQTQNMNQKKFYQERIDESNKQLIEVLERWKNREGRPEDLEKIERLEHELKISKEQEKKAKKEMSYFKNELINREENFNERFCKPPPNVGVMNVIKEQSENINNLSARGEKNMSKMRRHSMLSLSKSRPQSRNRYQL